MTKYEYYHTQEGRYAVLCVKNLGWLKRLFSSVMHKYFNFRLNRLSVAEAQKQIAAKPRRSNKNGKNSHSRKGGE